MIPRSRSKKTTIAQGMVYTTSGGYQVLGYGSVDFEEGWNEDYWQKECREDKTLPPSPCVISTHHRDPLLMHRNTGTFRYDAFPVNEQGTASQAGLNNVRPIKGSDARLAENNTLALQLLASTNPFRSEYSVPVALKELVDVSTMFKLAASSFASYVGGSYLNYKFGWTSFVRDVKTLHSITKTLESRIREFQSLNKHGGVRRSVKLGWKRVTYSDLNRLINSTYGTTVRADVSGYWQCQIHGTVRWRLKPGFDVALDKLQAFNLAVTQVFDLGELDSQTMWNLVPFSWLVDYFVDVNSYFAAHLGDGVIEHYDLCIVRESQSEFQFKVVSKPSSVTITGSSKHGRLEYDRDVVSSLSFPVMPDLLLSRGQWAVIIALIAAFKR